MGVEVTDAELIVHLENGHQLRAPLDHFPRLKNASQRERSEWRLIGRGIGIHWPLLDEDISVENLLLPRASLLRDRRARAMAVSHKKAPLKARRKRN
jgi:hypothetical protein